MKKIIIIERKSNINGKKDKLKMVRPVSNPGASSLCTEYSKSQ